jgi:alpha-L-fucosidase
LDEIFSADLARKARKTACNLTYSDDKPAFTKKGRDTCLELDFPEQVKFNVIELREHLPAGQRVESFAVDVDLGGKLTECARGEAIGSRALIRCGKFTSRRVRLRILKSDGKPAISKFDLFFDRECP